MYKLTQYKSKNTYRSGLRPLALMVLFFLGAFSAFGDFAGGTGSIADPFQISNVTQLQAIKDATNTAHFILINDIDASATAGWNGGQGFLPIGWFGGSLEGQGYTISDLTINRPGVYQTAMFTHIGSDAVLKNFHLDNVSISGGSRTGALSGTVAGLIENVSVSGTIQGTSTVGGLAGQVNAAGSIIDCHADVSVSGSSHMVGGLVGNNNEGALDNNSSEGDVSGQNRVGGLVGSNAGPLTNSHSASVVNGDEHVGGLAGFNHNTTIEACYSTGSVSGVVNVGGLVGFSGWNNSIVRLSFSTADVEGTNNQVGGLIGRVQSGIVENTFARGEVTGNNRVGGLVGEILFGAIVNNSFSTGFVEGQGAQIGGLIGRDQGSSTYDSFWDEDTSGLTTSDGGAGKTSSEMLTQSTFTNAGWDFNNIWSMDPDINDGYPFLIPLTPTPTPGIYYSRTNGVWNDANTWSTDSHTGPPAIRPPIPPDQVIIGNGHQITLTDDVTNNQSVTVNATGTLVTGQYVIAGNGNFFLQAGATLQIGSADGISTTAATGSIQTLGRSFNSGANYVYNGTAAQQTGNALPAAVNNLRIDNSQGVAALTSLTVNGPLQLDNGIFTMPPGSSLVANNVDQTSGDIRMQLTIDGDKGWRMITSPVGTNFADLLDGFVSQGFGGATFPNKQPNILWFDETEIGTTNMAWRAPSNMNDNVAGGRGLFYYIFNGAEMLENGSASGQFYDDSLPITMDANGLEYATGGSTFNFNITHTERSETNITDTDIIEMNTGWNLVGNPSTASLDWNATSGWTKTNVDETIYIWDPAANNGNGDFLFWNGSTGTLDNGLIAPFQAFWVRANNQNPVLAMGDDVKTTGGTFVGSGFGNKSEAVTGFTDLRLKLEAGGMESTAFLSFSEKARMGEDPYDAYQLESLSDNWLNLYTTAPCCQYPLVINHLPDNLKDILHIPVYVQGQQNHMPLGGTYKLSWSMPEKWPLTWQAVLMDHAEKKAIPMDNAQGSVSFSVNHTAQGAPAHGNFPSPLQMPRNVIAGKTASANSDGGSDVVNPKTTSVNTAPAFSIVIFPGELPEVVEYMAPEPILLPVYPNPVRHFANIRFNLPRTAKVNIQVFDLYGRRVGQIVNGEYAPGIHAASWTATGLTSGVYFVVMDTEGARETQKLIVK